jgi:hypothetical protein
VMAGISGPLTPVVADVDEGAPSATGM